VPLLADCNPGFNPTEYNVLIAIAEMSEVTKGGIIKPDETRDRESGGMQVGRLVAKSPIAFNYDQWPTPEDAPQVGQVVWFARYAGGEVTCRDGRTYRIVKDKDIGGVIPE
jgi:co-chaperonin GroES (HSP10)